MAYTLRAAIDRARKSRRLIDVEVVGDIIETAPTVARSNHVRERLGKTRCEWLANLDPQGGWL